MKVNLKSGISCRTSGVFTGKPRLGNQFPILLIGSVASAGAGWKFGEEWEVGLCAAGFAQSPVDLGPAEFDGGIGEFNFVNYESEVGRTISFSSAFGGLPYI